MLRTDRAAEDGTLETTSSGGADVNFREPKAGARLSRGRGAVVGSVGGERWWGEFAESNRLRG